MWIILKYTIRQFFNYWRYLPLRIKIEIIILISIFYIYGIDQFVQIFRSLLTKPDVTPLGLSVFVQLTLLLPMLIGTPFIYFNLIPKQKSIQLLRLLPLNPAQSAALFLVHFWKYEFLFFIIILPVSTAVGISLGLLPIFYLLVLLCLLPSITFLLLHLLSTIFPSIYKVSFIYITLVTLYYVFFIILYLINYYIIYQIAILIVLSLFVYHYWFTRWEKWDLILNRFHASQKKQDFQSGKIQYSTLARYLPLSIRPIFSREILIQIRNSKYLRLKVLTLIFFLIGTLLVQHYAAENFRSLLALLIVILVWWHYSSQFNEKYVLPESKYFLKILPLRYYQFVVPKFLSELIYLIMLTCLLFIIFLWHGEGWQATSVSTFSMFLVSIFILLTTIIFKTLFYDKPRLAGYAYHFMILFCLIMTINFYFLGPLITVCLLIYFTYKSYQSFSH